ncbi:MAG: hypothetical protein WCP60_06565 [bacterium]
MKTTFSTIPNSCLRFVTLALCTGGLSATSLFAGTTTNQPTATPEDPAFNNWINSSVGGLIIKGNQAQFQQAKPTFGPVYGGIDDMHYEQALGNKTTLKIDGHAIFGDNDYKVILDLTKEDLGFIRAGFTQFNTYYNGNGGYLPPSFNMPNSWPNGQFTAGPEYTLTRGSLWAELGLRTAKLPDLTLRYEHAWRKGQEDSTEWGGAATGGVFTGQNPLPAPYGSTSNNSATRKILPSFRNINETRDIFTLTGKQTIGKPDAIGVTDLNLNLCYELDRMNDSLNWQNTPGAAPTALVNNKNNVPMSANAYNMTQTDKQILNNYNGNISSVTRFGEKLWLTMGYAYSALSSDIDGGTRVAGPIYGSAYSPYYNNLQYANKSGSYINLGGGSQVGNSVGSINIMWMPIDGLTITPSGRFSITDTANNSNYLPEINQVTTNTVTKIAAVTKKVGGKTVTVTPAQSITNPVALVTRAGTAAAPTSILSTVYLNEFTEDVEVRYTKVKNWVFYADANWDEQYESTMDSSSGGASATVLNFNAVNGTLVQKYAVGANWYPLSNLNGSIQYYRQLQGINQNIRSDDPTRANQRLLQQNWCTDDGNVRLTWNPFSTVSLVSRYDVQRTIINSSWAADPNQNPVYPYGNSSVMKNQSITESLTWSPLDRLFLQGSLAYVLNQIDSPAVSQTAALQSANNNYWTASAGMGYAFDKKTQVRADVTYYTANNYQNNSQYGVPYNAGGTQYTFSASLVRQITRNVSMNVKYYFDTYSDSLSGGNNNYTAQMISTGLNMQF